MLLDANLLIYAINEAAPEHQAARAWLSEQLNGSRRVGLPWQSLTAFIRIATHPRAFDEPVTPEEAWERVGDWIAAPAAWIPQPGPNYADVLGELVVHHDVRGNIVPDAALAALALEHGLVLCSTDTDFARFTELRWRDPLAE